jgi:hypothetical protein
VRDAPADSRVVVLETVALTKTYVMGELEVQALRGVDLVFRHAGGWAVYAIDHDVAQLRSVELGRRTGTQAQILSGLEPETASSCTRVIT